MAFLSPRQRAQQSLAELYYIARDQGIRIACPVLPSSLTEVQLYALNDLTQALLEQANQPKIYYTFKEALSFLHQLVENPAHAGLIEQFGASPYKFIDVAGPMMKFLRVFNTLEEGGYDTPLSRAGDYLDFVLRAPQAFAGLPGLFPHGDIWSAWEHYPKGLGRLFAMADKDDSAFESPIEKALGALRQLAPDLAITVEDLAALSKDLQAAALHESLIAPIDGYYSEGSIDVDEEDDRDHARIPFPTDIGYAILTSIKGERESQRDMAQQQLAHTLEASWGIDPDDAQSWAETLSLGARNLHDNRDINRFFARAGEEVAPDPMPGEACLGLAALMPYLKRDADLVMALVDMPPANAGGVLGQLGRVLRAWGSTKNEEFCDNLYLHLKSAGLDAGAYLGLARLMTPEEMGEAIEKHAAALTTVLEEQRMWRFRVKQHPEEAQGSSPLQIVLKTLPRRFGDLRLSELCTLDYHLLKNALSLSTRPGKHVEKEQSIADLAEALDAHRAKQPNKSRDLF